MKNIEDIKNIFYINLDTRPDRKSKFEEEMKKLGLQATRFKAVKHTSGALGCSISHLTLLKYARDNKLDHIVRWTKRDKYANEFSANIDENTVEKIMLLQIDNHWKVLLLMGIGAITNHTNVKYNEIIKELAQNQKLYVINSNGHTATRSAICRES